MKKVFLIVVLIIPRSLLFSMENPDLVTVMPQQLGSLIAQSNNKIGQQDFLDMLIPQDAVGRQKKQEQQKILKKVKIQLSIKGAQVVQWQTEQNDHLDHANQLSPLTILIQDLKKQKINVSSADIVPFVDPLTQVVQRITNLVQQNKQQLCQELFFWVDDILRLSKGLRHLCGENESVTTKIVSLIKQLKCIRDDKIPQLKGNTPITKKSKKKKAKKDDKKVVASIQEIKKYQDEVDASNTHLSSSQQIKRGAQAMYQGLPWYKSILSALVPCYFPHLKTKNLRKTQDTYDWFGSLYSSAHSPVKNKIATITLSTKLCHLTKTLANSFIWLPLTAVTLHQILKNESIHWGATLMASFGLNMAFIGAINHLTSKVVYNHRCKALIQAS